MATTTPEEYSETITTLARALRWYADPKNWGEDDWGCRAVIQPPDYGDGGAKARRALRRAGLTHSPASGSS